MSSKKIVVVTGATGLQGGSVAKYLLNDGTFAVRAVTRNPNSPAAQKLAKEGASVVAADLNDPSSLSKALEGTYGVFGVTNYWEPGVGGDGERAQGKALVDAAKKAGIKHFVWSTLDRSEIKVPHYESKADIDDYLKASGVPRTSLYTTFFYENFLGMHAAVKGPSGELQHPYPEVGDAPFYVYSVADTGAWVLQAFKHPDIWVGKDMRIAADFLNMRHMINTISEVTGKKVQLNSVTEKEYREMKNNPAPHGIPQNMLVLFQLSGPSDRDLELAHKLHLQVKSFRAWVEENSSKFFNKLSGATGDKGCLS